MDYLYLNILFFTRASLAYQVLTKFSLFYFIQCEAQIIKKAIKKLKSDSAAGPDDIPPILIKK